MNLLEARFLPYLHRDGRVRYCPLSAVVDPDVVDLALPRADFQSAAWQWLIGLLQTAMPPSSHEAWVKRLGNQPSSEQLAANMAPLAAAFRLFGDGPVFMQDLDTLEETKPVPVAGLLIDSPGANGIKLNTDHFVKRGRVEVICPDCAAIALFTLQINAPSGGAGHRVGLRGGGPLTTLILAEDARASLWQQLWLNIMPVSAIGKGNGISEVRATDAGLFPWMGPTHTSEKPGTEVLPDMRHSLHSYWAMPRRIRLLERHQHCTCDLCGRHAETSITEYRTRNYGANYSGPWRHPLTPYREDPKKPNEPPLSLKGQPGGVGYRHWSRLVFGDRDNGYQAATAVQDYHRDKVDAVRSARDWGDDLEPLIDNARLWVSGFDLDNMKPRGWYSVEMPLTSLDPQQQSILREWLTHFVALAEDVRLQLTRSVKKAWFSDNNDVRGDLSFITADFFDATEPAFVVALGELQNALRQGEVARMPSAVAQAWHRALRRQCLALFDSLAMSGDPQGTQLERCVTERHQLQSWLGGRKSKAVATFARQAGFNLKPPASSSLDDLLAFPNEEAS